MVVSAGSIASSQQRSPRGSKNSGVSPVRSADGGQQNEQSDLNVTAASNELLQVYSNKAVFTARCYAERGYEIAYRLSVCPSVCDMWLEFFERKYFHGRIASGSCAG